MTVIASLSEATNIREDGLRLFLTILAGYPLAALHRTFTYRQAPQVQHAIFVIIGIALYWFNYGYQIYHSLFSIFAAYLITNHIPGTTVSVTLAHVVFLGHLLVGYWFAESSQYDITWTTPFCIMTLRFIGLVMDVYDGQQPKDKLKGDQLQTAISDPPGILEIAAYGYFFAGSFVGPQFTLSRFRSFVNGEYLEDGEVRQSSLMVSVRRFVAGVTYVVLNQWGAVWIPDSFFISPEFLNLPFIWKVIWNSIWFKTTMWRYTSAWCLTEGAAILAGLGYNGKSADGKDKWDGVRDLHIMKFEFGSNYSSVVESFNVGTNTFAKNHIFKRLKWLGNKYYSQGITLVYLAVWHGYHLGYFLLFLFEFGTVVAQEQLFGLIRRTPGGTELFENPIVKVVSWVFGKITITVSMAFAFLTFGLIKKEIWWTPVKAMYFWGYLAYFVVWPITYQILLRVLPRKPKAEPEKKTE
uniref:Lysophospholipid acyltransferase 5 n=1 Tax=Panagrellus redivivus TaxID=6233 RepID=A0A7E4W527_PANRE